MPFKDGWIQTINAVKVLWGELHSQQFKFLRTRALNQDCVENIFSSIRQYGVGNFKTNCYQFVSVLKTAILNNLVTRARAINCEIDEHNLLGILQEFLEPGSHSLAKPIVDHNELLDVELPEMEIYLDPANCDSQAICYVAGYLIKKVNCDICCNALTTDTLLPDHIFVIFKEYDDNKNRLNYASPHFIKFVGQVKTIFDYVIENYRHIGIVLQKL
jgi:hypothetical protein